VSVHSQKGYLVSIYFYKMYTLHVLLVSPTGNVHSSPISYNNTDT